MQQLSLDEMIGQLFWIGAPLNVSTDKLAATIAMVKKYKPGGVIFFKNTPQNIAEVTNKLQEEAKVPLLMSIDGEWGLGMRLQGAMPFPFQMTLGAIQQDQIIEDMGYEIGRQFRRIGLHVNLAPVADINTNPANPIIGRRSFGENPSLVAKKTTYYMLGLQGAGVAAVAKHFPGHGDTSGDSHKLLPISNHTRDRLDTIELIPFQTLINAGIMGIMSAHMEVPSLESKKSLPATLSKNVITKLLKEEMGFKGFVITDAMNMHGVTASSKDGNIDLRAIEAGNDIIEMSINLPKAFDEIKQAIQTGKISRSEIENKCRKVLAVKEWCGLANFSPVSAANIDSYINRPYAQWLNHRLYRASVTVLKNSGNTLPLKPGKNVLVQTGHNGNAAQTIKSYTNFRHIDATKKSASQILSLTDNDETLVVLIERPGDISNETLKTIASKRKMVAVYLGNPYHLSKVDGIKNADGIVIQYENNQAAIKSIATFLSGTYGAYGKLPVSTSGFKCGDGIDVPAIE